MFRGSTLLDGLSQISQHLLCRLPRNAGIGDALAVAEGLAVDQILAAFDEVALQHDSEDVVGPRTDLAGEFRRHYRLSLGVLLAVAVAEVVPEESGEPDIETVPLMLAREFGGPAVPVLVPRAISPSDPPADTAEPGGAEQHPWFRVRGETSEGGRRSPERSRQLSESTDYH